MRTEPASSAQTTHPIRFRIRRGLDRSEVLALQAGLRSEEQWDRLPKLSVTHRSSVARLGLASGPVAIKRYDEPRIYVLRTFARQSRAERETRAMDLIAAALSDAPVRVLAWAEVRRFGFVTRSYLVTNELEGALDLRAVKGLSGQSRAEATDLVMRRLPAIVAALHDAGIHLRALRGKNILMRPSDRALALIDQPLAHAPRRFGLRHRLRDLATLSLELRRFLDGAEWSRFLEAYLDHSLDLDAAQSARIDADQIEDIARRLGHDTPLRAAFHTAKRRLSRTRLAASLSGRNRRTPR